MTLNFTLAERSSGMNQIARYRDLAAQYRRYAEVCVTRRTREKFLGMAADLERRAAELEVRAALSS